MSELIVDERCECAAKGVRKKRVVLFRASHLRIYIYITYVYMICTATKLLYAVYRSDCMGAARGFE